MLRMMPAHPPRYDSAISMATIQDDVIHLRTGETIPLSALDYATSRSGGPGGQNVNKVETKVEVRLQIDGSPWLSPATQERLARKLAARIDREGALRVTSSTERTQLGNRNAAVTRLLLLLDQALTPEKKRIPTKATRASKQRRVESKKRQGEKKQGRRRHGPE